MLRYSFFIVILLLLSCGEQVKETPLENSEKKNIETSDSIKRELIGWENPMLTPVGSDLVRMLRAYYLVGDIDKLLPFLLLPPSMNKIKLVDLLQKANWGYDLKVTNVRWMNDSIFQLSVKTLKQQTTGLEFYEGKIVNDTAKLFVYPNSNCPFVKEDK